MYERYYDKVGIHFGAEKFMLHYMNSDSFKSFFITSTKCLENLLKVFNDQFFWS